MFHVGVRPARVILPSIRLRLLSTPVTNPSTTNPPNTPSPPFTKQKLVLRPAPVKPAALPFKPLPKAPSFKEATTKDIQDAEAHGVLKPPPEGAGWAKRTLHKAIEIAKFYYRGVKLIFIRRKDINLIHARIKAGGSPLTRAEFRLIRTQRSDINKVVPFLFIALLLEEIIPLIAIYAPFMLPSTCILPSQRERIDAKSADKATAFSLEYRSVYDALKQAQSPPGQIPLTALSAPPAATAVCGLLRLSTTGIDFLRIRRIRSHLQFLAQDDKLLVQDTLLDKLSPKELEQTLGERGMQNNPSSYSPGNAFAPQMVARVCRRLVLRGTQVISHG
ncbi:hypothetical protein H0H92_004223 [Tricholoma furcatifolium]|nr:hypothetical protein H0H92_004223 [Tricholoma furcatifolium]